MFTRFDTNKSTKGASKLRRDLINAEIANLRDLLPLPQSTRQRLSQLQLMALVCVYVRKSNYFQQVFKRYDNGLQHSSTPNIGFSKALCGFLMMVTQNGKLLYISDNAAEYLGHSMEDLLIHGDSVYDIIDKQDYNAIQAELGRAAPHQPQNPLHGLHHHSVVNLDGEHRIFLCRMNVSRNARRQMRFGDQKVVLIQGHYLSYLPLCSRNEPVFLATCTPIAMPETRECVVQGATNVFTTIHSMDMKVVHIDKNGEFHLGYAKEQLSGMSWYQLIHWDSIKEAQMKHRLITQSEQDRSCILLLRLQKKPGDFIWVHVVLQVRENQDTNQHSVIVATNQVLSEREAAVMLANSWLYHYYSVQSKIQMGMTFDQARPQPPPPNNGAPYFHPYQPPNIPPPMPTYQMHQNPYDLQQMHMSHHYHSPPSQQHLHEMDHKSHNSLAVDYSHQDQLLMQQHHPLVKLSPTSHENSHKKSKSSNDKGKKGADEKASRGKSAFESVRKDERRDSGYRSKKYTFKRIESLHISDSHCEPMELPMEGGSEHIVNIMDHDSHGHTAVYMNSSIHTRSRITKAFSSSLPMLAHPPHLLESQQIEEWSPSPTWSDSNIQKVPDIIHQQLSPYLITTPPTPISAHTITNHAVNSFTFDHKFDWSGEQYVPTSMHPMIGDERHSEAVHLQLPPRCMQYDRQHVMAMDDGSHEDMEKKHLKQLH